jgi:hypothetical protein
MSSRSSLGVAVGWVERSETHRAVAASNTESVGFASLLQGADSPSFVRGADARRGKIAAMTEQFQRRLAAARDRAAAEKQRAEKQAAAERQTLEQLAGLQRAALRQWQKRIFPLIKQVVETANKELRGSGMRLIVAEDYVRVIAFADIFGAPEANLGVTKRPRHDPHLRISVEGGEIATMILHGSSTSTPKRMLPANFQLPQVEDAVAQFVEGIVGARAPK